jgi:hypothetical protein
VERGKCFDSSHISGHLGAEQLRRLEMIRRLLMIMALLIVAIPAVANEPLILQVPARHGEVRSMLLWPPSLTVPHLSISFLFDAQGPVTQPYPLIVQLDNLWCEPEGPAVGISLPYLTGRTRSPHLVFAEPAGQVTGPTDADGMTAVALPLRGGGHGTAADSELSAPDVTCELTLDGGLMFNSPDLNGDLAVDLTDVALFAQDYFGPYNYRSDLYWDGQVGLNDLVYIAIALEANR